MPDRSRIVVGICVVLGALSIHTGVATAQAIHGPVILHSGDDRIELTPTDEGGLEGEVSVTNLRPQPVPVALKGLQDGIENCAFQVAPASIPAERAVALTITSAMCELPSNGARARLEFGEREATEVTLFHGDVPGGLNARVIPYWYGIAGLFAALIAVAIWLMRPATYGKKGTPGVGWSEPVPGIDGSWSLSESWASNLTVGATAFAALFGATEILKSILGQEPEVAVARVLIASAATALLVAAAPLAMKLMGKTSAPSVGGLIVGAAFTLTGAIGQFVTVGWAILSTSASTTFQSYTVIAVIVATVGLLLYGYRTISILLQEAFAEPKPVAPTEGMVSGAALLYANGIGAPSNAAATMSALVQALKDTSEEASLPDSFYPKAGRTRRTSPGDRVRSGVL